MAEIYGHRWTSAYGADPNDGAALTWAKGLAGVSSQQLADGLKTCIASADPWPPTLPEFRARCLGIPSIEQVRIEMRSQDRSPFTRLVWLGIDGYRFKQVSADQSDRMLREAYDLARERVMRGDALPEAPAGEMGHEVHEVKPASPEVVEARQREINEILNGKAASAGPDA